MKKRSLPLMNLIRKPGRTLALAVIIAFLALAVFGGSVVVLSLRGGLQSLEARLGADIILVPSEAQSKVSFQNMFLQGTTGAFYMDASVPDRALEVEGVEKAAPQTFLASLKADCCSIKIQVIGIDPALDFTVQPWISRSLSREMGDMDVVVGCKVEANIGEIIRIYEQRCKVVARLEPTGTGLDTAVYCNMNTMNMLLAAAEEKGVSHRIESGDSVISAVYVKVRDGFDIDTVNSRLNGHLRKVTAVRTRSMITGVSDSLAGINRIVTFLIAAVWALAFAILLLTFVLIIRERTREFAVLRLAGASRGMLSRMVLTESFLCGLLGGLTGTGLAALLLFPFARLIESMLGLPYLMPETGTILLLAAGTVLLSAVVAALSSVMAAVRLSRVDPGTALREGN
ncbi:MAG: FtsX-like permease family protein [Clostridia bacterium]|nr:FtsX-like permease family protein [Clostridia bacterium]